MIIILKTLAISFLVQVVFFIFAAYFKTDKLTDLSYGLTFIFLALFALFSGGRFFSYQLVLAGMIFLWGLRLAAYLFIRILKTGRDKRFDGIREKPIKFVQFWFFQAITIWIIMLPSGLVLSHSEPKSFEPLMVFGILIWLLGLTIETMADYQKFVFKSQPENKSKWIESGLWKYSRHPNYFGEILCWWGIFIFTASFLSGWFWLTIASPIFITFILLFVSGLPPLEKKYNQRYAGDKAYLAYKRKTSLLIPLPSKER